MIVMIDNYDSFVYNLYQLIGSIRSDIEVYRNDKITVEDIKAMKPEAIVISPGPGRPENAGNCMEIVQAFAGKIPILGVCLGHQIISTVYGGTVSYAKELMHGKTSEIETTADSILFQNMEEPVQVARYHSLAAVRDTLPEALKVTAWTADDEVMAVEDAEKEVYGIQFHPEVYHSTDGTQLLKNFVVGICGCSQSWTSESFVESTVRELREKVGDDKVVLGLSGGVDSSVAAVLLHKAIGKNLYCIFVDSGLLRKNEFEDVLESYKNMGLNVKGVKAGAKFLGDLAGVSDPETKRKIIGRDFVEVFNEEAVQIKDVRWLAQGTIYPDVIESVSVNGPSATIKSHHNVGGLPEKMNLRIVEPLRLLFKDEVRRVGRSLGISEQLIGRHPFPGPGLAIRILGDITPEKVEILQNVDKIYIDAMRDAGLYDKVWQAGAILLPVKSVGVMGDERTYESCVALRAVTSTDGMTADWVHLPYEFLANVSNDIINKVKGVNRVVYDISSKPPATIEWE